jgi:hypothetical protein
MTTAQTWQRHEVGGGRVHDHADSIELTLTPTADRRYSNAQIDDYSAAMRFHWRPPLRLSLYARATGAPCGTAGFGFWNHPFAPNTRRLRPPQALWFFFGAPPNHIPLALDVPPHGWKAATINAARPQFWALLPTAPLGVLLTRHRPLYRPLWRVGQAALGIHEAWLGNTIPTTIHHYTLDWHRDGAVWRVDDRIILHMDTPFSGPFGGPTQLGFVAWIDNQYAIATPQGRFGGGLVPITATQGLVLQDVQITAL